MDPFFSSSQDFLIIIVLPLMVMTLRSAWIERQTLWDANVTARDRDLLMRITMFVLMPIVVFLHECGHAAAILQFGGKIAEFHYGILWGYVVPSGIFTPEQILTIYLAGNVVEILCGLLALLAAFIVTSPPVVAVLIYLAIWSISGTAIVYAMMSTLGMYGDWVAIYNTSVRSWIPYIGTIHAVIVVLLLWALYGKAPRLWFVCRTRPLWAKKRSALLADLNSHPTAEGYLDLAWLYYEAGLDSFAQEACEKSLAIEPQFADPLYLQAWLQVNRGKVAKAQELLTALSTNTHASAILKARSLMSVGQLAEDQIKKQTHNGPVPPEMWKVPLEAFTAASLIEPELGDPRFYRARTLNKAGLHTLALAELEDLSNCKWLDPKLGDMVHVEIGLARKLQTPQQ